MRSRALLDSLDQVRLAVRAIASATEDELQERTQHRDDAVRAALSLGAPHQEVHRITGLTKVRIRELAPRNVQKPKPNRRGTGIYSTSPVPLPENWPPNVAETLVEDEPVVVVRNTYGQVEFEEIKGRRVVRLSGSVWAIPSGLPSLGKRR